MNFKSTDSAVVIFSGGQDSTTCLAWAKNRFKTVEAMAFHYGQKHKIELEQAAKIAGMMGVPFAVWELPLDQYTKRSALLDDSIEMKAGENGAPASTFVDGRNHLMLSFAAVRAKQIGAKHLITGVCQTDFSGYPDCRDVYIKSLQVSLTLGMSYDLIIHTPLMWLTKAQTFQLAEDESVLGHVLEHSHTCYKGDRSKNHTWGYGCGECPACVIRKNGYDEYAAGAAESALAATVDNI